VRIHEVLRTKGHAVHTVQASEKISEVLKRFAHSKIRCLVATDGTRLSGLLTIRDVIAYIDREGAAALDGTVEQAMTKDVISITPDTSLEEAEDIFADKRFHHLPVEEDGAVVGLVTPADVLGRHLEEVQETSVLLRDYCSGVYY
jgi:CBS domain-containing protein